MASVRVTIRLTKPLLERADAVARDMKVSLSRLIALALEGHLRRRETADLVERINAVYADGESEEEQQFRRRMLLHARQLLEGQW